MKFILKILEKVLNKFQNFDFSSENFVSMIFYFFMSLFIIYIVIFFLIHFLSLLSAFKRRILSDSSNKNQYINKNEEKTFISVQSVDRKSNNVK